MTEFLGSEKSSLSWQKLRGCGSNTRKTFRTISINLDEGNRRKGLKLKRILQMSHLQLQHQVIIAPQDMAIARIVPLSDPLVLVLQHRPQHHHRDQNHLVLTIISIQSKKLENQLKYQTGSYLHLILSIATI